MRMACYGGKSSLVLVFNVMGSCTIHRKQSVRAKIVEKAESWKWSSARAHIIGEHEETVIFFMSA
jgi:hypothetical protein